MTPKEKAKELVDKFLQMQLKELNKEGIDALYMEEVEISISKKSALICVENEYHEKRELLFLLKSNGYDIPQYSKLLDKLIKEEQEVKSQIEKL